MQLRTILGVAVVALACGACDKSAREGQAAPVAAEQGAQEAGEAAAGEANKAGEATIAAAGEAVAKAGGEVDYADEANCPFHDDSGANAHTGCDRGKADCGHHADAAAEAHGGCAHGDNKAGCGHHADAAAEAHGGCAHGDKKAGCGCGDKKAGCDCGDNKAGCGCPDGKGCAHGDNKAGCDCGDNKAGCDCGDNKAGCDCGDNKAGCGCPEGAECDCAGAKKAAAHEGCAHGAGGKLAAAPAADARHFGAPFTVAEATPLAKALEAHGEGSADTLKITGRIHKVCAKKGCWMVVKDGDAEARVVMKGYAFTVPTTSQGKQTTVEGTLKVKTFTEAQAKHLAIDAGEDPAKVTGERKELLITASGISIQG